PQLAGVPQILGRAQIRVEAERLGQVADLLARQPGRLPEQRGGPGRGLHHAPEDLERRRLTGAVGPDEAEDLSGVDVEVDPAHGLQRPVALRQRTGADREAHRRAWRAGHVAPSTRISPSAGMPGLANPSPLRSRSLTPTTCFTRSSRKYVFSGVNDAWGSIRITAASSGADGAESR